MKQTGRPPNAIKELCKEHVFNDKLIEKLVSIATSSKGSDRDKIRAIEVLLDRAYGKPEQEIEITQNDSDRPSTDVLIQTITALRTELDALRAGTSVAAKE